MVCSWRFCGVVAVLLMLGCAKERPRPLDPVWGKQPCAHCSMLVSERATAAQLTTVAGERLFFDDLGCLIGATHERGLHVSGSWTRDMDGKQWIEVSSTRYMEGARTPMDFGFMAAGGDAGLLYDEVETRVLARLRAGGR